MKTFFIGDMHFGHENVLRFDKRPFSSTEEMETELIKRWNNKVAPGDLVYVIGDIIWRSEHDNAVKILKSLNGQKILIKGNHDRIIKNTSVKKCFSAIKDYDDILVILENGEKKQVILSHYFIPMFPGHRYGAVHLHAHSHTTEEAAYELEIIEYLKSKGLNPQIYNVGCMYWNYEPVTLDEILKDSDNNNRIMADFKKGMVNS